MTGPAQSDLEGEQEVDIRRYGMLLAARWWLVAAGLLAGLLIGLTLATLSGSVWKAKALISLGQPYSPTGGTPVVSFATSPRAVSEIIRSEAAMKRAAAKSGMRIGNLRGHVSSGEVATGTAAARSATLLQVTVQGPRPARVAAAANALARIVVARTTAPYVGTKIAKITTHLDSLQQRINIQTQVVTQLQQQANNPSLAPFDRLVLSNQLNGASQLLGALTDTQTSQQQQLAFAQNIESATIVEPAEAVKTTARSKWTSALVGAVLGLILGAFAAILWEPLATRAATRSA